MRSTSVLRSVQVLVRAAKGNPTGLTGILQHPDPRPVLIEIYNSTIHLLQTEFPEHSVYRKATMDFTKERLSIVQANEKVSDIEDKIGNGLIEEILIQANDEHNLANLLRKEECWDDLCEKPLEDQWTYFGKKL